MKKSIVLSTIAILAALLFTGCDKNEEITNPDQTPQEVLTYTLIGKTPQEAREALRRALFNQADDNFFTKEGAMVEFYPNANNIIYLIQEANASNPEEGVVLSKQIDEVLTSHENILNGIDIKSSIIENNDGSRFIASNYSHFFSELSQRESLDDIKFTDIATTTGHEMIDLLGVSWETLYDQKRYIVTTYGSTSLVTAM
ncbi:MAG: hypothetical protein ACRCTF_04425 [Bacteroidales bacterium]